MITNNYLLKGMVKHWLDEDIAFMKQNNYIKSGMFFDSSSIFVYRNGYRIDYTVFKEYIRVRLVKYVPHSNKVSEFYTGEIELKNLEKMRFKPQKYNSITSIL